MIAQYAALVFARGAGSVLNALGFIWVARLLSLSDVGRLGAVIGILTFVFLIADLGMSAYIPRERARGNAQAVISGLKLNVSSSWVFGVVSIMSLFALGRLGLFPYALALLGLSYALEKNTDTALSVAVADRAKWIPVASVLLRRFGLLAFFGLFLLLRLQPLWAFGLASAVAAIIGQIHIRLWLSGAVITTEGRPRIGVAIRASVPFFVANLSASARSLDVPIVSAIATPAIAGLYSAAGRLIGPFALIPAALTEITVPHAARKDGAGARALLRRTVLVFMAVIAICALAAIFSEPIVTLTLGHRFAPASTIFAVLLLGLPFVALSSPLGAILQGQGHERFVSTNGVLFAVLLLAAIVVGALAFGGIGAASAVGVVYLLKCFSLVFAARGRLGASSVTTGE